MFPACHHRHRHRHCPRWCRFRRRCRRHHLCRCRYHCRRPRRCRYRCRPPCRFRYRLRCRCFRQRFPKARRPPNCHIPRRCRSRPKSRCFDSGAHRDHSGCRAHHEPPSADSRLGGAPRRCWQFVRAPGRTAPRHAGPACPDCATGACPRASASHIPPERGSW
ncbi:MAG: hypothetical protein CMN72_01930 [Sphingomonas sp.]|nr:hypothetical protein [Sphingomonas sp.]